MYTENYESLEKIEHGDKVLMDACDRAEKNSSFTLLASEKGYIWLDGSYEYSVMNCSNIQTKIIKEVGRLCDSYASDVLCELNKLNSFMKIEKSGNDGERWIIGLGIRDMGVDHNKYIMNRLNVNGEIDKNAYREILALDIKDTMTKDRHIREIRLYNITYVL